MEKESIEAKTREYDLAPPNYNTLDFHFIVCNHLR